MLVSLLAIPAAANTGGPIGSMFLIRDEPAPVEVEQPAVAYNGQAQEYLVVFYNDRPGNDDIRAERVSKNGTLLGGVWVSAGSGADRRYPDVTYDSQHNQYLVVWEHYDQASARYSIRGRFVSATGVLEGEEIIFSSGPNPKDCTEPAVAYSSTSDKYLVVWTSQEVWSLSINIEAQVLTGAGVLDGGNFYISRGAAGEYRGQPDLAYNRQVNEYLVVWRQLDHIATIYDIYGCQVDSNGDFTSGDIELMRGSASNTAPAVAALPIAPYGQYLVVWELQYAGYNRKIYGRVVDCYGRVHPGFYVYWAEADESSPAVTSSEISQEYLVTWTSLVGLPPPPYPLYVGIFGRSISTDGSFLSDPVWMTGFFADHAAVASGAVGDTLIAFEDAIGGGTDIWGLLWGNRLYLPLVLRNH